MNTPFQPDLQINRRQAMQRKAEKEAERPVPPTKYDDVPLMRRGVFATTKSQTVLKSLRLQTTVKCSTGFPMAVTR